MKETGHFFDFGPFRLDARKHLLLRDGQPVSLSPRALDTLLLLVQNRQRVVEKDELMKALWPNAFVEEGNLTQNISAVRKALGEAPSDHRYVLTVPGRGYRFVAAVEERSDDGEEGLILEQRKVSRIVIEEQQGEDGPGEYRLASGAPADVLRRPALPADSLMPKAWTTRILAPAALFAAAALLVVGLSVKFLFRQKASVPELKYQQLTFYPIEAPVLGAAVSADGKYLAYIDQSGISLRVLQTGETHPISFLKDFTPTRFPLKWFPDGTKLLVSGRVGSEEAINLWAVSILGGTPRKLREGGPGAVSPDGSLIAYIAGTSGGEIWSMGAWGEAPRRIVAARDKEHIYSLAWGPMGRRIAYVTHRGDSPSGEIQSCDLSGGQRTTILSGAEFSWEFDLAWGHEGRMIYPYRNPPRRETDPDLWEIQVDPETGRVTGQSRRLTSWPGSVFSNLTLSADGKRLLFVRSKAQPDVYVGELEANGSRMKAPKRLTLDESDDWPQGWTRDGRAVLFHSNRRGNADIYMQDVQGGPAQPVVASADAEVYPRSSPDGRWILYWAYSEKEGKAGSWRLMRVASSGGPPEFVLQAPQTTWFRCPTRPGAACVLGEIAGKVVTFVAFDPVRGRGAELRKVELNPGNNHFWDLSPDGSRIALVNEDPEVGRFQILSLDGGPARVISIRGWNNLANVAWSADGKGFYVITWPRPVASILNVDFNGNAHLLWESGGSARLPLEPLPSPDGKFLAFSAWTLSSNAWMIENF